MNVSSLPNPTAAPTFLFPRRDFYEILQVSKGASDSQIKRSYRKLALQYHPVSPPLWPN